MEEIPEFTLVSVVAEQIQRRGKGFIVPFQLSGTPDGSWWKAFEAARSSMLSTEPRPTEPRGDQLLVEMLEADNKQAQVNYLKTIIAEANAVYRRACEETARRDERYKQEKDEASARLRRFQQEASELDI